MANYKKPKEAFGAFKGTDQSEEKTPNPDTLTAELENDQEGNQEQSETPQGENQKPQEQEKEPSIPLSQVSELVQQELAKALANLPQAQPQIIQQPVVAQQNFQTPVYDVEDIPELRNWVMKDRQYVLVDESRPQTYSIAKAHTENYNLTYTNKENKSVHPLRYATNQISFLIEKQTKEAGSVISKDIIFVNGMLKVPADNIILQKFLAIHPHLGIVFKEYDPKEKSEKFISARKLKTKAENKAYEIGDIMNRAICSLTCSVYTELWNDEQVLEENLKYIEKNADKFLEMTTDPTIKAKGIAKFGLANGDLKYQNYRWLNREGRVLIEVAKNKDEFDEIVKYFESSEGRSLYEYISNSIQ